MQAIKGFFHSDIAKGMLLTLLIAIVFTVAYVSSPTFAAWMREHRTMVSALTLIAVLGVTL